MLFDLEKLNVNYFSPHLYLFSHTNSQKTINNISKLKNKIHLMEEQSKNGYIKFLYVNPFKHNEDIIFCNVINKLGDYNINEITSKLLKGAFVENDYRGDSLISLSCANNLFFACITDFWGIITHYWYHSEDTFICSNNIFLVSHIIGNEPSLESLYEYLFFSAPRKEKTWFKKIQCLIPGQQLIFNLEKKSLCLSSGTDFSKLFEKSKTQDLLPEIKHFFIKAKDQIGPDKTNYISLSYGSDSRLVLACLRAFNMDPHGVTFGRYDMLETRNVSRLTHKLSIPWFFIDIQEIEKKFKELFIEGTFYSSGFLNPLRNHYVWFYNHIRRGNALFEGILGSEFLKGEIAVPAMISQPYYDVIVKGLSIQDAIKKNFSELSDEFKDAMASYIEVNYGSELLDVNSDKGFICFQNYLLNFIPSKIFAGTILLALANCLSVYYPFLSQKILQAIFSRGEGMLNTVSIRKDFIGPIKAIRTHSIIIKHIDPEIFYTMLDRRITYAEALQPFFITALKEKIRHAKIFFTGRKIFRHQIDNTATENLICDYADSIKSSLPFLSFSKNSSLQSNITLAKYLTNYSYLCSLSFF